MSSFRLSRMGAEGQMNLKGILTKRIMENLTIDDLISHLCTMGFTADIDLISRQAKPKKYHPPVITFGAGRIIASHGVTDDGNIILRFSLIDNGYKTGEPVKGEDMEHVEHILYFKFTNKQSAQVVLTWLASVVNLFDKIAVDFERDEYHGFLVEC